MKRVQPLRHKDPKKGHEVCFRHEQTSGIIIFGAFVPWWQKDLENPARPVAPADGTGVNPACPLNLTNSEADLA